MEIKKSGTHLTIKIIAPIARLLNSVRKIQPMKGTKNPAHLQQKYPKSFLKEVQ